ncbi:TonB-dependent receptor [Flavobacterium sp.]|uniref:TonB-dependent receptor n=1 Tax=Flavobacterium sp. TaxID=239 RepID=UPI0031DB71AA
MKTFLYVAFILIFSSSYAQEVKGKISTEAGPLYPASILVAEKSKTVTNDRNGNFSIKLEPRVYHLEISSENYSPKHISVTVSNKNVDLGNIIIGQEEKLDEVVLEYYTSGEKKAIEMRQKSNAIMDVVSADAMGKMPDISAAEAVQRIPGVSIDRDQGEGRYVTVRGTPSQWSSATINGDRMPAAKTSGDLLGNRTVPMDLLPTEFLEYIQVIKAITPEYEGDAIGGTINYIPKFSPKKETLRITGSIPVNLRADDKVGFNSTVLYGNRLFNKKFGFLVMSNYNRRTYSTDDYEVVYGNELHNVNTLDVRNYQGVRTNTGFNAATDFRFNKRNKIYARGYYSQFLDEEDNRKTMHYFNKTTSNAVLRWSTVDYLFKNYGGEFGYESKLTDKLKMNAKVAAYTSWAGYNGPSSATKNDRGYYYGNWIQTVKYGNMVKVDGKDYKFLQGDGPAGYVGDPANNIQPHFVATYDPEKYYLDRYVTSIRNVEEKDKVAALDFDYDANKDLKIKFGGKFRDKTSTYDYRYITWIYDTKAPKAYLNQWEREAFPSNNWFPELNNTYDNLKFNYPTERSFIDPMGNPAIAKNLKYNYQDATNSSYATGNYDATEKVWAGYASGEWDLNEDFRLVGGVRYENTAVDAKSYEFNDITKVVTPVYGTKNYGAFLPMAHLIYKPSQKLDLRAAVTRTFARPAFNELSPSTRVNPDNHTVVEGNVDLKPTFSWNYDVIGSYYLNKSDYITGSAFYKNLSDLIYTQSHDEIRTVGGETFLYKVSKPLNSDNAFLYGFEVGFNKKFSELPGFLSCFSLKGNYTFTKSQTTLEERGDEKIGLMNQSPNIFNASLIYEYKGFAARLAANYREAFLVEIRDNPGADRYQDKDFHLDMNLSYTTSNKITFFIDLNNLTNQELGYYHGVVSRPEQVEYYGIRGRAGASYRF